MQEQKPTDLYDMIEKLSTYLSENEINDESKINQLLEHLSASKRLIYEILDLGEEAMTDNMLRFLTSLAGPEG